MAHRALYCRNDNPLALEALRLSLKQQGIDWEKLYEDYLTELIELRSYEGSFEEETIYGADAMGSVLLDFLEDMSKHPLALESALLPEQKVSDMLE